ncbi:amylo-alpha-1,6-glucosidase [Halobacillus sp. Marseille-Q1614]|uniref:amylo-alpha-1,6-glucosidase n=1 Tax=Halobacillus sp. Marseille-Q1614 TaxID=2709134 RepID=UPI001570D8E8|nr:amylo-alpha-1,6-glucosidase [Halobacillus sp. Marseille-Q1614]
MDYRAIKEGNMFLLTKQSGDIEPDHSYGLGLYISDTRFLSKWSYFINDEPLILLDSDGSSNYRSKMILTNPHQEEGGSIKLWRESVEVKKEHFIYDSTFYEKVTLKNYSPNPVQFSFSLKAEADFKDMFLIRGFQSGNIGEIEEVVSNSDHLTFHYKGADGISRTADISWNERGEVDGKEKNNIHFQVHLDPQASKEFVFKVEAGIDGPCSEEKLEFSEALFRLEKSHQEWGEKLPVVNSDSQELNLTLDQGLKDLRMLISDIGFGPFPVAGLPWFGVPFGRDSLIAAWQLLPFSPEAAKGTLFTLAHYQGTEKDGWRDEQPGKIMHELREGELAKTNQVPFTPYYGSIDSTPLFLMLLTEYVKWTGDLETFKQLDSHVEKALHWIEESGDLNNDEFVEYFQESSKGIANQGWKDSADSVVHKEGKYAEAPIALVEVQGYVYQAKTGLADIYQSKGDQAKADQLNREAESLRVKFEKEFWLEDEKFYAIALDKDKKQVASITSNPGHLLLSNITSSKRSKDIAERLLSEEMFSGYGIRTMADSERAYNPMSYHDGSVWPHDNSLSLLGMSKLGFTKEVEKLVNALLEASSQFEHRRLPELFCGYSRERGKIIRYPVACSPQAWAAGTSLTLIQSLLGIFPNAMEGVISINPTLCGQINELTVHQLPIAKGYLSLQVLRTEGSLQVDILENTTGLKLISNQTVGSK